MYKYPRLLKQTPLEAEVQAATVEKQKLMQANLLDPDLAHILDGQNDGMVLRHLIHTSVCVCVSYSGLGGLRRGFEVFGATLS